MKTFHGFSLLSLAMLLVAAIVLPVLLFPLGAALGMNLLFLYGYRLFKRNNKTKIFHEAIIAFSISNVIFLIFIFFISFEHMYSLIRDFSIAGDYMRPAPLDKVDLDIFKINTLVSLFVASPIIAWNFLAGLDQLCHFQRENDINGTPLLLRLSVYITMMLTCCLVILYFSDSCIGINKTSSDGGSIFAFKSDRQQALFLVVITIGLCYAAVIRELMLRRR